MDKSKTGVIGRLFNLSSTIAFAVPVLISSAHLKESLPPVVDHIEKTATPDPARHFTAVCQLGYHLEKPFQSKPPKPP